MTKALLFSLIIFGIYSTSASVYSQTQFANTEDQFHDLFITAGYSTAFGAALGAAFIGLSESPEDNLHFVAMGASLGFIGGSVLGAYIIVTPSFADASESHNLLFSQESEERFKIGIHPLLSKRQNGFGLSTSWNIN